jgi:hypothetical protein
MGLIFFAVVLVFTIYFFSFKNFFGDEEETTFKRVIAHINHQTQPLMITSVFNEAYYSFCVVVMNIGIVCGNRREYSYLFESNKNNWMQYNFEKDDDTGDDDEESLMTKISFNKEIQWNHTSDIKSFFRFVILIPLLYLSILLYVFSLNIAFAHFFNNAKILSLYDNTYIDTTIDTKTSNKVVTTFNTLIA